MQAFFIVALVLFVLLCLLLIVVVLIQQRTKGGIASVLGGGGGGAEQIFGSSGVAPVLTRVTAIFGAVFMFLSLLLVLLTGSSRPAGSIPVSGQSQPGQTQPSQAPIPEPIEPLEGQPGGN